MQEMYTLEEVAEKLDMSLVTIRRYAGTGKIDATKIKGKGNILFVYQKELDRYSDEMNKTNRQIILSIPKLLKDQMIHLGLNSKRDMNEWITKAIEEKLKRGN